MAASETHDSRYEYDSDDSTGEWTCGQWLWLICWFTGAALFLLSSPLTG